VKTINESVSLADLKAMAQDGFGNLVKAVVDVDREIMAVDGELHADEEALPGHRSYGDPGKDHSNRS
jgi:hypothetical protein